MIDLSFGSSSMQPIKQNSQSNVIQIIKGSPGQPVLKQQLLNQTFQHHNNLAKSVISTPSSAMDQFKDTGLVKHKPVQFIPNLPQLNQTLQVPKNFKMKGSEMTGTQSNIQLNTIYKPNPKGARALRGNQGYNRGSEFFKELDFSQHRFADQTNNFSQIKSKSLGPQRKPAINANPSLKTPSFQQRGNYAQSNGQGETLNDFDSSSYINFVLKKETSLSKVSDPTDKNIQQELQNKANFHRNFNKVYMSTQKQNQRRKLLYEFCLAKEHMAIEKPISVTHAPEASNRIQRSPNFQQKHKLLMEFISNQNLENIDVNQSQQVNLIQVKYQNFEKDHFVGETKSTQNGRTIDYIEKNASLSIHSSPVKSTAPQKPSQPTPQFNIEAIFQGGTKKLQALSDHQKYDLLKLLINLSSKKMGASLQNNQQKELSRIKFHLSKLQMDFINKQSSSQKQVDQFVLSQTFQKILMKAKQVQIQEKLLKSHQTNETDGCPQDIMSFKEFKFKQVTEQVQILKSHHQKYLDTVLQDQDSFYRVKYEDVLKDDDINMRSHSQVSSDSSEYSQTYHKVSNKQSPRAANSDLSTQIDTQKIKRKKVEASSGNVSSQNYSRVSEHRQVEQAKQYKRLTLTSGPQSADITVKDTHQQPTNEKWVNFQDCEDLDDYREQDQYPELESNARKDTEENDYLMYKSQIKRLKEDSKPSYQRNRKREKEQSRNSKMSEKYQRRIHNVSKIKQNEFTTVETLEMHRKNQVAKLKGNGLAIQMANSGSNEPKSELNMFDDKLPVQRQEKSKNTQNTPQRNTTQQDFFGTRNFGNSDYNHNGLAQNQGSIQNDGEGSHGSNSSPFKAKHYHRIKKPSIARVDDEEYQLDKPPQIKNSELFQNKQPMVTFTTMTDAVKKATNGRKDNLPNLNTSRQHQYGLTLQERVNANFSYPSNPGKKGKHDVMNMTARGKSNIGFGSSDPRGIGQKLNTNYKDMESLMGDLNQKANEGNPDSIFGVSNGMNTLNVQKMVLAKHTPTRYEQNRAQFEQLLRQTLQSQISQMKKKKEKIQEMCYNDIINSHKFNNKYTNNPMQITNQFKNNQFQDYNGIFKKSKHHHLIDDASSSSSQGKSVIHLVSLDGPNPNDEEQQFDNKKKQQQKQLTKLEEEKDNTLIERENEKQKFLKEIKDRAINNILEVKKLPPKYYPPRKLPNPFEDMMLDQQKLLQNRKDAQAKYSEISKNRYKQDEGAPFKFVVRPGNNSQLIYRVINESGRTEPIYDKDQEILFPGWEKADDQIDSLYNFKWKPTSHGINYEMISKHGLRQLVNHVRGHHEITTKDRLFLNMKTYYEALKRESIYEVVPLTIVLDYMNDGVGDQVQMFQGIHKIIDKVSKQGNSLAHDVDVINSKIQKYQAQNCRNVKTVYKITPCCHKKQNLWLLKPTGFNRGIGIHIFQTYEQLCEIMSQTYGIGRGAKDKVSIQQPHKCNLQQKQINQDKFESTNFVIQKLIERPLLFKQRKFDIRVWVIVNSFDGKCYMYKESYVRTSSKKYQEYDPNKPNDEQIFMQLTNNAIQSQGEEYGKYEEGNIISTYSMMNYVSTLEQANDKTTDALIDELKASMIMLIQNSIRSVKGKLASQKYTFELLGYDFILDEQLNTFLIEVNTNPCLEESNHLLRCMLPRMIDDMLNIVSDPIFNHAHLYNQLTSPPVSPRRQMNSNYRSIYKLPGKLFGEGHPGYADNENLFEHICYINE